MSFNITTAINLYYKGKKKSKKVQILKNGKIQDTTIETPTECYDYISHHIFQIKNEGD